MSVIILPSKSSTWRLSAFLMSHIFKDHFCPSGYFWFQPATRIDTWPYNYYKTAGQRFTAASLIISYLSPCPSKLGCKMERLWGIALKLNSDPVLHCVFEATIVQCSCIRTCFLFLLNNIHFFLETATVWVWSKIRRLCFISVRLTCHLKEEIILFVLHLSVSAASFAAKACCKADQHPPAAELTFWLPWHGSFVEGNTVFCMEELANGAHVSVSGDGAGWRVLWACGASTRHSSFISLVMGCGAQLFPLPLSFDCFFSFVHLHNLIPLQLCLIA